MKKRTTVKRKPQHTTYPARKKKKQQPWLQKDRFVSFLTQSKYFSKRMINGLNKNRVPQTEYSFIHLFWMELLFRFVDNLCCRHEWAGLARHGPSWTLCPTTCGNSGQRIPHVPSFEWSMSPAARVRAFWYFCRNQFPYDSVWMITLWIYILSACFPTTTRLHDTDVGTLSLFS